MKLRSLLFVPADNERKLAKSLGSAADVLILDLEDAVAQARNCCKVRSASSYRNAISCCPNLHSPLAISTWRPAPSIARRIRRSSGSTRDVPMIE